MLKAVCLAALALFATVPYESQAQTVNYQVDLSGTFPGCPARFSPDDAFAHRRFQCLDGSIIGFVDVQNGSTTMIRLARLSGPDSQYGTPQRDDHRALKGFVAGVIVGAVLSSGNYNSRLPPDYSRRYGRESWRNGQRY